MNITFDALVLICKWRSDQGDFALCDHDGLDHSDGICEKDNCPLWSDCGGWCKEDS